MTATIFFIILLVQSIRLINYIIRSILLKRKIFLRGRCPANVLSELITTGNVKIDQTHHAIYWHASHGTKRYNNIMLSMPESHLLKLHHVDSSIPKYRGWHAMSFDDLFSMVSIKYMEDFYRNTLELSNAVEFARGVASMPLYLNSDQPNTQNTHTRTKQTHYYFTMPWWIPLCFRHCFDVSSKASGDPMKRFAKLSSQAFIHVSAIHHDFTYNPISTSGWHFGSTSTTSDTDCSSCSSCSSCSGCGGGGAD